VPITPASLLPCGLFHKYFSVSFTIYPKRKKILVGKEVTCVVAKKHNKKLKKREEENKSLASFPSIPPSSPINL
jgi:hypothetical protein